MTRRPRRRRTPGPDLLPHPGRLQARLLPLQASPDLPDEDAPRMAHRAHPRGSRRIPRHVRLPQGSRRTDDGDGRLSQLQSRVHVDARRRPLRATRTDTDQAAARRRDRLRPREPEVPPDEAQRAVGHRRARKHRTREGWLYCCCVLDANRGKIVGWSIDSSADTRLVLGALDMAIKTRNPAPGGVVHADHGTQFTSWACHATAYARPASCPRSAPSATASTTRLTRIVVVLDADRTARPSTMEHQSRARQRLSIEYIEVWHNRARRHSSIGYLTPVDFELQSETHTIPARAAHLIR